MSPEDTLSESQWDGFVKASPHGSFLQSWAWGEMQRELGVSFWRLSVVESGVVLAVALVIRRELPLGRCWLYVPRGPVFGGESVSNDVWKKLEDKLGDLAIGQNALFIRCDPAWEEFAVNSLVSRGWIKSDHEVQPRHTSIVDLKKTPEEILAAMHAKTRYNIRLAEKKGVKIRFSREVADLETFLRITKDVRERSPFHYHPDSYYLAMLKVLAPAGLLEVAVAEYEGEVLAAHIMINFGGVETYAHGASSSQQRSVMAPYLLQWAAMERALAQGCHSYDLFGVAPPDADASHSWQGITRFKLGFGGQSHSYVGAYDLVLDKTWYGAFEIARRVRKLWH